VTDVGGSLGTLLIVYGTTLAAVVIVPLVLRRLFKWRSITPVVLSGAALAVFFLLTVW
jgi:hypothetical protein